MLSYFPTPRPDECLYSIIARFADHTLNNNPKVINRILFGNEYVKATIDFPGHLSSFHETVESVFPYSITDIIEYFTLYLFYLPFLKLTKRKMVFDSMLSLDASTIHTRVGINASSMRRSRFPYYCPICVIEDIETFGETYFRRSHQIPDMKICLKHKCYLIEIRPRPDQLNSSLYISPRFTNNKSAHEVDNKLLLDVATIFENIHCGKKEIDINNLDYRNKKCIEQYLKGKILNRQKLVDDFQRYFSSAGLKILLGKDSNNLSWVPDIIHRPEHVFHPIKHVLVKMFVDSSPMLFVPKQSHPFGNGPWKCINKASTHFLKEVITNMTYHIDSKSKRVIGIFTCSCGMVYTKSFLTLKNGQFKEFIRIKEWGKVWNENLQIEITSGKGLREIARTMGADPRVIKGFMESPSVDDLSNQLQPSHSDEYKRIWIELLEKYPDCKILNARKEAPIIYAWLYRNAYQWLMDTNQKHLVNTKNVQLKLNWEKLDGEILVQLETTLDSLKSSNYPAQLTRTFLAKSINQDQYLLGKSILKLPKSNLFLNNSVETIEDYQKRRVSNVIRGFIDNGNLVAKWKIMRKAGLKTPLSQSLETIINEAVQSQVG